MAILRSMPDKTESLQNHFLIAMPQLHDPNFSGALTYICEHTEDGAMGLIVNKPSGLHLNEVLEQLELPNSANDTLIYAGGPVQMEHGFVLHSGSSIWDSSLQISDNLSLTTSRDILQAIGENQGPEHYLLALGYAGWGAGQLEQELKENTWLTCRANQEILFHTPDAHKLRSALAILGIDTDQLNGQIGHA